MEVEVAVAVTAAEESGLEEKMRRRFELELRRERNIGE